ncbi:MAG: tetratricopeptide repeat protein [Bacteroidetes bacterium]|nr:MAG: tetratricopeptide repeat protein [Bacteroidota bacterium]
MIFSSKKLFPIFLLFLFATGGTKIAIGQTLELREICSLDYRTDFASLLEKNKDSLFPSSSTLGSVHFYRGLSYLEQSMFREAIMDFRIARTDSAVSRTFCNFYIGVAFMRLNQSDSILKICSEALNIPVTQLKNPAFWQDAPVTQDHIFSGYLIGTNQALNNPTDSNLIEICLSFGTKDREFLEAYINYGVWNFQNGRYNKTIDLYKHAVDLEPSYDSTIILCMGYVYRLAGDPDHSMKAYILLKSKYPRFAEGFNNRGCLYAYLDKNNKALSTLTVAIRKDRTLLDALCNRGLAYLKMKRYKQAFDDFTEAIQIDPRFADAYYYRGFTRKAMGDIPGSITDYSRAIDLKK